ncbi:MAG: alpha/beta hydrolase [Bacteroidia bacterium]|nr:MAG: alpha/beta hydrolase [Bacteroidia bacterium]
MELSFTMQDGSRIRVKIDRTSMDIKGVIVLIHGLGEHLERYNEWAGRFVDSGFSVIRVDLPGHGRSGGKRGHIKSFGMVDEIISNLTTMADEEFPGVPVILYGHSLGGTFVLNYLLSGNGGINLAIVTSPWIKLSFEPPRGKMILASVVKNILPALVQPTGLVPEHLSHDHDVVKRYIEDPLVHYKISVALFSGVHIAARAIMERGSEIKLPLLLLHGEDDLITSPGSSSEFAMISPGATFKLWKGGYHELHNEPFRDEIFKEIVGWLNSQL